MWPPVETDMVYFCLSSFQPAATHKFDNNVREEDAASQKHCYTKCWGVKTTNSQQNQILFQILLFPPEGH